MAKLIVYRLLLGILTLFAVSVLIFVCTQILPGDVASAVLGQGATPEALIVFRRELGLDVPAYLRYWNWLVGALHGDLGVALTNKRVIIDDLLPRLRNTLFLAGYAAVIAIPLSVGLGVLAAINEGKLSDRLSNILTLIAISLPEFPLVPLLGHGVQQHELWRPGVPNHAACNYAHALGRCAYVAHDTQFGAVGDVHTLYRNGLSQRCAA